MSARGAALLMTLALVRTGPGPSPARAAPSIAPEGQVPEASASPVRVDVEPLAAGVHRLQIRDGDGGWVNALVLQAEGGSLLVDHAGDWRMLTVPDEVASTVRETLERLGVTRLRYLVNTHWHGDHSAGNPLYDALVVAHAGTRDRLVTRQAPPWYPEGIGPMDPAGWPELVFDRALTLEMGSERVHLWNFGPAHTIGDAVVYLEVARVAHLGDLYHGLDDPSVAEDMVGLSATLAETLARLPPGTRVVTGHGGITGVEELRAYQAMLEETLEQVQARMEEGAGLEAIQAEGLPDRWAGTIPRQDALQAWIGEMYRTLASR